MPDIESHFRHAHQGVRLDALGGTDKYHGGRDVGAHGHQDAACDVRRHDEQDNLGAIEGCRQSGHGEDVFRQPESGQVGLVFTGGTEGGDVFRAMPPEGDGTGRAVGGRTRGRDQSQRRSPTSGANHGNSLGRIHRYIRWREKLSTGQP